MTTPVPAARLLPALILGASLLAACGGDSSEMLVNQARASLAAGDTRAAIIQLKNAIGKDEKNPEARFLLGTLQLQQGEFASAEKEFRRAREAGMAADRIDPLLAQAWLRQGEFQRVLDEIPQPAPGNPAAAALLAVRANAQLGLKQTDEARATLALAQAAAPDDPEVRLTEARLALVEGNTDAAMAAIEDALKADPKHRDVWLFKANLLRATGKAKDAVVAYQAVLQIDPQNLGTRLALADIAISENRLADARREADAVLKAAPNNLIGRYTLASIDFREKKTEAARDQLAAVLKAAPDYLPAVLLGGAIEYSLGNLQSAETSLNKVVKVAPRHPYALRLLAATQLRLGRPDDAARTISVLDPANSKDAGVHVIAAEIALARKEFPKASAHLEKAAQISPESAAIRTELGISRMAQGDERAMDDLLAASNLEDGSGRADTILILEQLKKRQFDTALASIAALEKKLPASPVPWNYRGAAYLGKKDFARARASFERALEIDPKFLPAAANLARLDLKDKQPDAAKARFERILKADPKQFQAMLALANLARMRRDEKDFLSWLDKAVAANPQALRPRLLLTRHWLAKGNNAKAVAAAREAVNIQPNNPEALDLLGTAQFAGKDLNNALGTYRKLTDLYPKQAKHRLKLAQVQNAMKQVDAARKTLREAIQLQPNLIEAQRMLGGLEIQAARYDEALKIAKQLQQHRPDDATGFVLEGDTALARQQYPAAIAAYERAHLLAPAPATLTRLHRALAGNGRHDEGEKRLTDWLAAHPTDHGIRLYLAGRLHARGKYQAAADHYLHLNQQVPGNVVVLNNLASALSESGDKRALSYAEQALKLKPDDPAVMDTLGWILVRQGQPGRGVKLLQQALSKMPDVAEIHYHLAMAYAETGDRARARQELKRLLDSGRAFPQEKQARVLLKQLGG
jgi:putative PEP-CTERM system TPR-repeat lipoprotein